ETISGFRNHTRQRMTSITARLARALQECNISKQVWLALPLFRMAGCGRAYMTMDAILVASLRNIKDVAALQCNRNRPGPNRSRGDAFLPRGLGRAALQGRTR